MKKFIKTVNSTISASELAECLKEEYNIDNELVDNGIYVEEENYEEAIYILLDMELELENIEKDEGEN